MRDHCTFFPDKLFGKDLSKCCDEHDDYWYDPRSDEMLRECIIKTTGWKLLGWIMYLGVKIGRKFNESKTLSYVRSYIRRP